MSVSVELVSKFGVKTVKLFFKTFIVSPCMRFMHIISVVQ